MKSFNDLWIKSNSFCHLREQSNESPFPRCPVTGSWQLFPRHLDTIHHLSKHGIVAHQIKPRRLFFHPSRCVLCLNSRCFNISFCELILYSSIFKKINPSIVSFCRHRVNEDFKSEDVKINICNESTTLWGATWIAKIVLVLCPLCLLTSRLESQDEILV